jgi:hypothetical protein
MTDSYYLINHTVSHLERGEKMRWEDDDECRVRVDLRLPDGFKSEVSTHRKTKDKRKECN